MGRRKVAACPRVSASQRLSITGWRALYRWAESSLMKHKGTVEAQTPAPIAKASITPCRPRVGASQFLICRHASKWRRLGQHCGILSGDMDVDHIRAPQLTCGPIVQGDFHCSRSQEPARSQYELGSRVPVIFHIHVVQATHHPALALAHVRHVDREAVVCDAEFLASAKVRCDFRAVDDVLARQTRD